MGRGLKNAVIISHPGPLGISVAHGEFKLLPKPGAEGMYVVGYEDKSSNGSGLRAPGAEEKTKCEKGKVTEVLDGGSVVVPWKAGAKDKTPPTSAVVSYVR
ncbi:unnamed protein product [Prorocentrum cordatum]|uniref:Uncharacterized protein n=1 Tax=Prorocentrum cordatum TaxID=2364126 RepID=A0ABN9SF83_9DINO|nr:unnamed protein product [Polarella glacialis]